LEYIHLLVLFQKCVILPQLIQEHNSSFLLQLFQGNCTPRLAIAFAPDLGLRPVVAIGRKN
ncbi:hypothetical protein AVEN_217884-1, partial [Araneus ventricosus]